MNVPVPRNLVGVWDNGGKTADQYTLLVRDVDRSTFSLNLSPNCDRPNGVSMIGDGFDPRDAAHLGRRVEWDALPENVRRHALERLDDELHKEMNR